MIQWKVDIGRVGDGAVLERAKIEVAQMQCEILNQILDELKKK